MVRLVYFLPSDRAARPERVATLRQLIKDAQEFYAEQMESHGFGKKTLTLETDAAGEPVVHRVAVRRIGTAETRLANALRVVCISILSPQAISLRHGGCSF